MENEKLHRKQPRKNGITREKLRNGMKWQTRTGRRTPNQDEWVADGKLVKFVMKNPVLGIGSPLIKIPSLTLLYIWINFHRFTSKTLQPTRLQSRKTCLECTRKLLYTKSFRSDLNFTPWKSNGIGESVCSPEGRGLPTPILTHPNLNQLRVSQNKYIEKAT